MSKPMGNNAQKANNIITNNDNKCEVHLKLIKDLLAKKVNSWTNLTLVQLQALVNHMIDYVGDGGIFEQKTVLEIEKCLSYKSAYNYQNTKKAYEDPTINGMIRKMIAGGFQFNPSFSMELMLYDGNFIDPIMATYDNEVTYAFLNGLLTNGDCNDLYKMFLVKSNNYKITLSDHEKEEYICNPNASIVMVNYFFDDPSFHVTKKITKAMARSHNIKCLKDCIAKGGEIDAEILELSCLSDEDRYEKIKFMLGNKIMPTKIAFNNILSKINDVYGKKQPRYLSTNRAHTGDENKCIDLLLNHGYCPTYDDVKMALKKKVIIKNVERYNIKFDSEYFKICADVGIYPYKVNIQPDVSCLEIECKKTGNMTKIKSFLTENKNVVPNSVCLQNACKRQNMAVLKFLISKGAKVDIKCLEQIIQDVGNRTLNYIFEEFMKNHTFEGTKFISNTIDGKDVAVDDKKEVKPVGKYDDKKKVVKKNVAVKTGGRKLRALSDSDSDDSVSDHDLPVDPVVPTPTVTVPTPTVPTPTVATPTVATPTVATPTVATPTVATPTVAIVPQDMVTVEMGKGENKQFESKIPKDFKTDEQIYDRIPSKICKCLDLSKKNKNISYLEFRCLMINHLKKENLIDSKSITLKKPFLYNGATTVAVELLNEWVYSLLNCTDDSDDGDTGDAGDGGGKPKKKNDQIDVKPDDKRKVKKNKEPKKDDSDVQNNVQLTVLDISADETKTKQSVDRRKMRAMSKKINKSDKPEKPEKPEKPVKSEKPKKSEKNKIIVKAKSVKKSKKNSDPSDSEMSDAEAMKKKSKKNSDQSDSEMSDAETMKKKVMKNSDQSDSEMSDAETRKKKVAKNRIR
jgi:hypothetical protein